MKYTGLAIAGIVALAVAGTALGVWLQFAVKWALETFGHGFSGGVAAMTAAFGPMILLVLAVAIRADLAERKRNQ